MYQMNPISISSTTGSTTLGMPSSISQSELDQIHYFTSLVEAGCNLDLISPQLLQQIQLQCLELLAIQINSYTNGESSSVPDSLAKEIATSNVYTIGFYLKHFSSPEEAIQTLSTEPLKDSYKKGNALIYAKLETLKKLHKHIQKDLLPIECFTYYSTVVDVINGFFKIYNADFSAHDIHITCDYPLCNPITHLTGIEYIEKYLESIQVENDFCNLFDKEQLENLLYSFNENYTSLIFNIFELTLIQALGTCLALKTKPSLSLSYSDVENIYTKLCEKDLPELSSILFETSLQLISLLNIKDSLLQNYIKSAIPELAKRLFETLKLDQLEQFFIPIKARKMTSNIVFSLGHKMPNEHYREFYYEVLGCRYISDKLSIIKRHFHSLADLDDLILDVEFTQKEIHLILSSLELIEVAVLKKCHTYATPLELTDLKRGEQNFCKALDSYILALSPDKQQFINETIPNLVINPN